MPKPWFTAPALAAVLCAVGSSAAEPQCISQSAKDALNVCPAGATRAGITKKKTVGVGSVAPPPKVEKPTPPAPPAPPEQTSERDAREKRLKPKEKSLLLREIA